jgi:predicted acetyltransferase
MDLVDPSRLLLQDGGLRLVLAKMCPRDPVTGWAPYYEFRIEVDGMEAGNIRLRIGDDPGLVRYAGHLGFGVAPAFRGHRYAERGCRLVLPLAAMNGMSVLWITCNPDNHASRRTCERLGAELVEIVDLPQTSPMYAQGDRQKCRYRLPIVSRPTPP